MSISLQTCHLYAPCFRPVSYLYVISHYLSTVSQTHRLPACCFTGPSPNCPLVYRPVKYMPLASDPSHTCPLFHSYLCSVSQTRRLPVRCFSKPPPSGSFASQTRRQPVRCFTNPSPICTLIHMPTCPLVHMFATYLSVTSQIRHLLGSIRRLLKITIHLPRLNCTDVS